MRNNPCGLFPSLTEEVWENLDRVSVFSLYFPPFCFFSNLFFPHSIFSPSVPHKLSFHSDLWKIGHGDHNLHNWRSHRPLTWTITDNQKSFQIMLLFYGPSEELKKRVYIVLKPGQTFTKVLLGAELMPPF